LDVGRVDKFYYLVRFVLMGIWYVSIDEKLINRFTYERLQ